MVPWSHLRQPFLGWVSTVWNSEFTHFNLVIHLSKLQQLALLFSSLFRVVPLFLLSQGPQCCVLSREAIPNVLKPPFFAATLQHRCIKSRHMNQAGSCLSGVVFFLLMVVWWGETCCASNSMELESCFMPIGARLDHGPGAGNNRTTFRHLGTESCF